METIQHYNLSIAIGLIVLILAIIIGGAYFIAWYGKIQAKHASEYEKKYATIERIIDSYEPCGVNYDWLNRLFDHLRELPYKNPEMTKTLHDKFVLKYEFVIKKRKAEDVI